MSEPINLEEIEGMYASEKRDRRFRAWLVVNAPRVAVLFDEVPTIADMSWDDFEAYHDAYGRFAEALNTYVQAFGRIRLTLFDQIPSGVLRSTRTVGEAWVAGGQDETELRRVVEQAGPLMPFDHTDGAISYYLDLHGLAPDQINWLLARWPREDAA